MHRVLWPAARWSLNLLLVMAAVVAALWALGQLRVVVVPTLAALLVATLLVPPVELLRRRGLPSAAATLVVMVAGVAALVGLLALVVPAFVAQATELRSSLDEAVDQVVRWLIEGPFELERGEIDAAVDRALASLRENAGGLGRGVLSGATVLAEVLAGTLLMLVLAFFFVHDGRRIWGWVVGLAPERRREEIDGAGRATWSAISAYMRGMVLVAAVDALLIGLALVLIGVPLVLPLMVIVFIGAFIPLVGAFVSGAVAALVALVSNGPLDAALVIAAITAIQQAEGDLLYPNVVGRMIRMHPVAILLALGVGTVVAGIVGALLAVPVAASAWIAYGYLREPLTRTR